MKHLQAELKPTLSMCLACLYLALQNHQTLHQPRATQNYYLLPSCLPHLLRPTHLHHFRRRRSTPIDIHRVVPPALLDSV